MYDYTIIIHNIKMMGKKKRNIAISPCVLYNSYNVIYIHTSYFIGEMAEVAKPPIVMKEKVSLGEAVEKVGLLQKLHITDQQPCIEALSLPVQYQTNFDTNFVDKNAFVTGVAKYIEEATVHANLVGIISFSLKVLLQ